MSVAKNKCSNVNIIYFKIEEILRNTDIKDREMYRRRKDVILRI